MYMDDVTRLKNMLDAAHQAKEFVSGRSRKDLEIDKMLLFALVRAFEIIGEAANSISDERKSKHPEVVWTKIIGMRNRLIHGYFDIDLDILWDTVNNYIPVLIEQLEKIV